MNELIVMEVLHIELNIYDLNFKLRLYKSSYNVKLFLPKSSLFKHIIFFVILNCLNMGNVFYKIYRWIDMAYLWLLTL